MTKKLIKANKSLSTVLTPLVEIIFDDELHLLDLLLMMFELMCQFLSFKTKQLVPICYH